MTAALQVEEIQALDAGPLRVQIEEETNRHAAAPYAVLDPQQRLTLFRGLSALPS